MNRTRGVECGVTRRRATARGLERHARDVHDVAFDGVVARASRVEPRARERRRESARRRMRNSGRGRRPDDSTDARGTVFDAHDDGKLGRRDRRPVLRVGARAQTLPPPNEKIVTEKKMAKVCLNRRGERRGRSAERWRAGNRTHRTVKRGKEFVVKFDDVWTG